MKQVQYQRNITNVDKIECEDIEIDVISNESNKKNYFFKRLIPYRYSSKRTPLLLAVSTQITYRTPHAAC